MSLAIKMLTVRRSALPVLFAAMGGFAISWFAASRTQPRALREPLRPEATGASSAQEALPVESLAADPLAAVALVPWLHVPMVCAALAAVAMAVAAWPLFGRDRPGSAIVRRLHPGFALGTVSATLAAISWLAVVLAAVCGLWFTLLPPLDTDGSPLRTHRHIALEATSIMQPAEPRVGDRPVVLLDARNPTVRFHNTSDIRLSALRIAPWVLPDFERTPPSVAVQVDGRERGTAITVAPGDPPRVLPFARPTSIDSVSLVWATAKSQTDAQSSPVLFPPNAIEGVGARDFGLMWNALIFAGVWLLPAWAALGLLAAASRKLSLAASMTVGAVAVVLFALSGLAPVGAAGDALARGRFIGTEPLLWRGVIPLGLGALGFGIAELLDRGGRGAGFRRANAGESALQ